MEGINVTCNTPDILLLMLFSHIPHTELYIWFVTIVVICNRDKGEFLDCIVFST